MTKKKEEKKSLLRTLIISFILIFSITLIYARYVGTTGLKVKEYIVQKQNIPTSFDGFKIVHFSDLHFGTTVFIPEVEKLIKEINSLKPNIIVFTGDLIDIHYNIKDKELNELIKLLNDLTTNIDSYIVKGNHDQSAAYDKLVQETNFKLLVNTSELFYYNGETPILIAGLDDYFIGNPNITDCFINYEENPYYTIMLAHEPDMIRNSNNNIDLFLSGHSHGGQIRLPLFGAIIRNEGAKIYYDEYYELDNTSLYISSGIGTSKLPLRLFNRPSINLYRLFAE